MLDVSIATCDDPSSNKNYSNVHVDRYMQETSQRTRTRTHTRPPYPSFPRATGGAPSHSVAQQIKCASLSSSCAHAPDPRHASRRKATGALHLLDARERPAAWVAAARQVTYLSAQYYSSVPRLRRVWACARGAMRCVDM